MFDQLIDAVSSNWIWYVVVLPLVVSAFVLAYKRPDLLKQITDEADEVLVNIDEVGARIEKIVDLLDQYSGRLNELTNLMYRGLEALKAGKLLEEETVNAIKAAIDDGKNDTSDVINSLKESLVAARSSVVKTVEELGKNSTEYSLLVANLSNVKTVIEDVKGDVSKLADNKSFDDFVFELSDIYDKIKQNTVIDVSILDKVKKELPKALSFSDNIVDNILNNALKKE